jgi:hypothetical protein
LGLNDNIFTLGNISKLRSIDIFSLYDHRKRKRRSHGKLKNGNIKRRNRKYLTLQHCYNILTSSGKHKLLAALNNLSIKSLTQLNGEADNIIVRTDKLYDTANIIQSYANHKLFPHIDKDEEHKRHFFNLKFINKGMDLINLTNIFNDKNCTKCIPGYFKNKEIPIISYSYNRPIRSTIFNYNKLVSDKNLDLDATGNSCDCISSKYNYLPAGHIITGNFNILDNRNLIDVFSKGPKYRLPVDIDFIECLDLISSSLEEFSKSWCKRENVNDNALNDWKTFILNKVKERIRFYISNPKLLPPKPSYSIFDLKHDLNDLQNKFIFVPADKAANNILII